VRQVRGNMCASVPRSPHTVKGLSYRLIGRNVGLSKNTVIEAELATEDQASYKPASPPSVGLSEHGLRPPCDAWQKATLDPSPGGR
jgi:hypothetical protein